MRQGHARRRADCLLIEGFRSDRVALRIGAFRLSDEAVGDAWRLLGDRLVQLFGLGDVFALESEFRARAIRDELIREDRLRPVE